MQFIQNVGHLLIHLLHVIEKRSGIRTLKKRNPVQTLLQRILSQQNFIWCKPCHPGTIPKMTQMGVGCNGNLVLTCKCSWTWHVSHFWMISKQNLHAMTFASFYLPNISEKYFSHPKCPYRLWCSWMTSNTNELGTHNLNSRNKKSPRLWNFTLESMWEFSTFPQISLNFCTNGMCTGPTFLKSLWMAWNRIMSIRDNGHLLTRHLLFYFWQHLCLSMRHMIRYVHWTSNYLNLHGRSCDEGMVNRKFDERWWDSPFQIC